MFMFKAIEAFCEMVKQGFSYGMVSIVGRPNKEIVKDKKQYKKGIDFAEKIIDITDKYEQLFNKEDLKKYRTYKTKFRKYN